MMLCSDVRAFILGVKMLFIKLNDHSDEDIVIVEYAVKSGFNVGIFEESFKF